MYDKIKRGLAAFVVLATASAGLAVTSPAEAGIGGGAVPIAAPVSTPHRTAADTPGRGTEKVGAHAVPGRSAQKATGGLSTLATPVQRVYTGARKQFSTATPPPASTGCSGFLTIPDPWVSTADSHSLAECSVQGGAGDGNIVEVIVRKRPSGALTLDTFAWRVENGTSVPACYNGCGMLDYGAETVITAGMDLRPYIGQSKQFGIQRGGGEWWVAFDNKYFAYWPDSYWAASPTPQTFTAPTMIQWFVEGAGRQYTGTGNATTGDFCSDLGNAQLPTSTTAARAEKLHIVNGTNAGDTYSTFRQATGTVTTVNPAHYNIAQANSTFDPSFPARNFRWGGPGAC
jgi:hypothetical protein